MIIHYNCTIGSFLLHFFLLIYHPYPPSFHEMIFILVYIHSHREGVFGREYLVHRSGVCMGTRQALINQIPVTCHFVI